MYTVKYYDEYLYIPGDNEYVVVDPVLKREKNRVDKLTFTYLDNHPLYGSLEKLKFGIVVEKEGKINFKGRIIDTQQSFYRETSVTVESKLAALNDSICRPFDFQGTPEELLTYLVENHNAQVAEDQQFKMGKVTVTDPNDYIVRSWEKSDKTWNIINDRLIDSLGGFLIIRYEEDGDYIDWLSSVTNVSKQKVEFGENLLELSLFIDATETYTACIPYGAEVEEGKLLTVETVNDNKDYLINESLAEEYGIIYAPTERTTWEDVTRPENLLAKARAWLNEEGIKFTSSLELSFVDMSKLGIDIDSVELYQNVEVVSEFHEIKATFLVDKTIEKLDQPEDVEITVGKVSKTLTNHTLGEKRKNVALEQIVEKIKADYVTNEKVTEVVDSALIGPNAAIENLEQIAGDNSQDISSLKEGLANTDAHLSNEIERVTTAMESSIEQSADNISLEVATKYATKDEVATERSRVDILSDQVSVKIKTIEDVESFMTFNDDGNLIIGKSDSEIKSVQDNDSYQFVDKSGNSLLEINTKGVNSPTVNVEKQVTYFSQWAMRKGAYVNGAGYNLNDVWIGG